MHIFDSSRLALSCGDERARLWGGASGLATWFMPKPCEKRNEKEFRVKRPRSMHHQSRIGTPQSAKSRDYVRISTSGKHASGKDVGYARIEKPDAFSFRFAYNGLRLSCLLYTSGRSKCREWVQGTQGPVCESDKSRPACPLFGTADRCGLFLARLTVMAGISPFSMP